MCSLYKESKVDSPDNTVSGSIRHKLHYVYVYMCESLCAVQSNQKVLDHVCVFHVRWCETQIKKHLLCKLWLLKRETWGFIHSKWLWLNETSAYFSIFQRCLHFSQNIISDCQRGSFKNCICHSWGSSYLHFYSSNFAAVCCMKIKKMPQLFFRIVYSHCWPQSKAQTLTV